MIEHTNHPSASSRSNPTLSIVIPAKNESSRLPKTLGFLRKALDQIGILYEIIVVDDGSADDTASVAEMLNTVVIRHCQGKGIAASIRSGCNKAEGKVVMTCPADVEDFAFLDRAIRASQDFDIVSVSKRHPQSVVVGYGAWRWFLSNGYHMLVRALFGVPSNLTDTHYIKLFQTDRIWKAIPFCSVNGPVGETELVINMIHDNASWMEVPARIVHNGNHSKTSMRLVARSAFEMALLFYHYRLRPSEGRKARREYA